MKNFKKNPSAISVKSKHQKVNKGKRGAKAAANSKSFTGERTTRPNTKKNVDHQNAPSAATPDHVYPPENLENDTEKSHTGSSKYICFVGNLPYGITAEAIRKFFHSVNIKQVRLLTDKATGQPRGCAFLELSSEEGYKKALAYHRQQLDGRSIRVQKTAGGGGKNPMRHEKIKKLNKKLSRERKRHWVKRQKERDSNTSTQDSTQENNTT